MIHCIAYRDDGALCRAPARVLDVQRGGFVCDLHAPEVPDSFRVAGVELVGCDWERPTPTGPVSCARWRYHRGGHITDAGAAAIIDEADAKSLAALPDLYGSERRPTAVLLALLLTVEPMLVCRCNGGDADIDARGWAFCVRCRGVSTTATGLELVDRRWDDLQRLGALTGLWSRR